MDGITKNGTLIINGFEITKDTAFDDIETALKDIIRDRIKSIEPEKRSSLYIRKVLNEILFEIKISYRYQKVQYIALTPYHNYEGEHTPQKNFKLNNEWLEKQLGEPDESDEDSATYYLSGNRVFSRMQIETSGKDLGYWCSYIKIFFGE